MCRPETHNVFDRMRSVNVCSVGRTSPPYAEYSCSPIWHEQRGSTCDVFIELGPTRFVLAVGSAARCIGSPFIPPSRLARSATASRHALRAAVNTASRPNSLICTAPRAPFHASSAKGKPRRTADPHFRSAIPRCPTAHNIRPHREHNHSPPQRR